MPARVDARPPLGIPRPVKLAAVQCRFALTFLLFFTVSGDHRAAWRTIPDPPGLMRNQWGVMHAAPTLGREIIPVAHLED